MKPMKAMPCTYRTGYMDSAVNRLEEVIEDAQRDLHKRNFDTLVGTGLSGTVVVPALALAMGKNFAIVRKEDDGSHHGGGQIVGTIGNRWLFVDDLVSSGRTRQYVIDKVAEACTHGYHKNHRTASFVGEYLYTWRTQMTGTEVRAAQKRLREAYNY